MDHEITIMEFGIGSLDMPLADFPKGSRLKGGIYEDTKVKTLRDLIGYSVTTLKTYRNIGDKTIVQIQFLLEKFGETLSFDVDNRINYKKLLTLEATKRDLVVYRDRINKQLKEIELKISDVLLNISNFCNRHYKEGEFRD